MGFYADLEIENKKRIPIHDEFGFNVGNPLAAFLSVYEFYIIKGKNSPEYYWFSNLEGKSTTNIGLLARVFYASSEENTEKQISEYVSCWQETDPITKEELFSWLDIENKWGVIEDVIIAVKEMIRILPSMGEDTYWYVMEDTYPAFKSLLSVLEGTRLKGGKRVRIHFE